MIYLIIRPATKRHKTKQTIAVNPNPGANENIQDKNISTNENTETSQAGNEIAEGEDG